MDVIPGYQQTDAGVIPKDWNAVRLSEIGEALIGLTYSPTDVATDGVLVLRSSNVQDGALCFDDNVFVTLDVPERIMVRQGDILICVRNGSRELIGKCALIDERARGMTFGAFMTVFRTADSGFILQQFKSFLIQRQIREHLGATINQITNKSLNSFVTALPASRIEREDIAGALSDADALVESLEQLLVKKRQIKEGTMQTLLPGKMRLPGFSGKWKVKSLGGLLSIRHGKSQRNVETSDGRYPILATGGEIGRADRFLCDKPSVLIGRKGTIDRPQFIDMPFWSVDTLFYSEVHQPNSAKFLFYRFCLIEWKQYNEASGVPSLNARTIEQIEIAVPEPTEQAAIAAVLSDMDTEIAALDARLAKVRQVKQGMMQVLLTGKIRLLSPQPGGAKPC